jgi:hypothetical protein
MTALLTALLTAFCYSVQAVRTRPNYQEKPQLMPLSTIDITTDDRPLILYLAAGRSHENTLKTIKQEFHQIRAEQTRQRRAALHSHHGAAPPRSVEAQPDRRS